jgi:hypothetical protein
MHHSCGPDIKKMSAFSRPPGPCLIGSFSEGACTERPSATQDTIPPPFSDHPSCSPTPLAFGLALPFAQLALLPKMIFVFPSCSFCTHFPSLHYRQQRGRNNPVTAIVTAAFEENNQITDQSGHHRGNNRTASDSNL